MSELLDATAGIVLATMLFLVGLAVMPENGLIIGAAGAVAGGYVAGRVGTLRQRVAALEAREED